MKNYIYKYTLEDMGFSEIDKDQYNKYQREMCEFVESMSSIIRAMNCSWDGVRYAVMRHKKDPDGGDAYMVVYCSSGERWIPITGNSKACNFTVLDENLW